MTGPLASELLRRRRKEPENTAEKDNDKSQVGQKSETSEKTAVRIDTVGQHDTPKAPS
jgi:hypothetical protein